MDHLGLIFVLTLGALLISVIAGLFFGRLMAYGARNDPASQARFRTDHSDQFFVGESFDWDWPE